MILTKAIGRGFSSPKTIALIAVGWACNVSAYQAYSDEDTLIQADLEAAIGIFHSRESYAQSGTLDEGSVSWQEAYLKYGLSLMETLSKTKYQVYGKLSWVSAATFGDGDAAGWQNGDESATKVEDAYLGWRSGGAFPLLGENGIDISFGRQPATVGDGFLLAPDSLAFGEELADGEFNRGGAYYLAPRKAYDKTAILRLGGDQGLRSDMMWLKSDNRGQAKAEMAVATLEHVNEKGTLGFTYLDVLDTDEEFAALLWPNRKGTETYSVRAQGSAGVENLFLSGEYARQNQPTSDESAWYLEAGWTFSNLPWAPSLTYRYSRFSEEYDPLFYGNVRSLGTWFQGEVASNYSGPFNSNAKVHHVGLKVTPSESLSAGVLMYEFDTLNPSAGFFSNLGGREIDLYAEWMATESIYVMPVLGIYKPDADLADGGSQIGSSDANVYGQIVFATSF